MWQVQILLPLYNQDGEQFSSEYYSQLRVELTEEFGGITAYTRSPAKGFWKEDEGNTVRDDIIIYEVMAETIDKNWWRLFRERLESLFRQDEIIIRAWIIELL